MPTYDYACDACEARWEEYQSITAKPTKKCPKCGKSKAKRLISGGGGIIFKGSGFYQTDYRSDSYKAAAAADSKSSDSSSSSSTTSSSASGGSSSGSTGSAATGGSSSAKGSGGSPSGGSASSKN